MDGYRIRDTFFRGITGTLPMPHEKVPHLHILSRANWTCWVTKRQEVEGGMSWGELEQLNQGGGRYDQDTMCSCVKIPTITHNAI